MKEIFLAVDIQNDFIEKDGALYVEGAEKLKVTWKAINQYAYENNYQQMYTGDCHTIEDEEISSDPDYKTTFPLHCLIGNKGAEFILEVEPVYPQTYHWISPGIKTPVPSDIRDIVFYKNKFDVFAGNPYIDKVLKVLKPDRFYVYGVATNVCVDFAVRGLIKRGYKVVVIQNGIKELPGADLDKLYQEWRELGATMINFLGGRI